MAQGIACTPAGSSALARDAPAHLGGVLTVKRLLLFVLLVTAGLALLAAPALASAATFYVTPSKSGNDTTAIQKAFNAAVKAGPGSTVQLTAGHFYVNDFLVTGFNGIFKGAGEGATVIDTLRGNPKTPKADPVTLMSGEVFPFLLGFQGGALKLSDLSFDISAPSPQSRGVIPTTRAG